MREKPSALRSGRIFWTVGCLPTGRSEGRARMDIDGLRGRRILVVEDESLILLTIIDILEELGCEVAGTAMRAEPALRVLDQGSVDAALLDVNLGEGRTSYPVAEALAERGIPFAFVTGYGAGGVRPEYRDRQVLSKPIERRAFEVALRTMMADPRGSPDVAPPLERLQEG